MNKRKIKFSLMILLLNVLIFSCQKKNDESTKKKLDPKALALSSDEDLDLRPDYLENGDDVMKSNFPEIKLKTHYLKITNSTTNESADLDLLDSKLGFERQLIKWLRKNKALILEGSNASEELQKELRGILENANNLYIKNNYSLMKILKNSNLNDNYVISGSFSLNAKETPTYLKILSESKLLINEVLSYQSLFSLITEGDAVKVNWPKDWKVQSDDYPSVVELGDFLKLRSDELKVLITLMKEDLKIDYFSKSENYSLENIKEWANKSNSYQHIFESEGELFPIGEDIGLLVGNPRSLLEELNYEQTVMMKENGQKLNLDFTFFRNTPSHVSLQINSNVNQIKSSMDYHGGRAGAWSCPGQAFNDVVYAYKSTSTVDFFPANYDLANWWFINGISLGSIPENQVSIIYEKSPNNSQIIKLHILSLVDAINSISYRPGYTVYDNSYWIHRCLALFGGHYNGHHVPQKASIFSDEKFYFGW